MIIILSQKDRKTNPYNNLIMMLVYFLIIIFQEFSANCVCVVSFARPAM